MHKSPYTFLKSAVWVHLFLSALILFLFKFQALHLTNKHLLIFVNSNMLITSAFAILCVALVLRRTDLDAAGVEFWKILMASLGLLFATESAGAIEEMAGFADGSGFQASFYIGLLARLALIYLAMRVIVSSEISTWTGWSQALLPWLFIISFGIFVLYFVVVPMYSEHNIIEGIIGPIFMVFAGLVVLIFLTTALAGRRMGDPGKTLAYFWPLAGLVVYIVTDVMYYCHLTMNISAFVLWELGFFAGYLFSAYGALLMLEDNRATL
jgi:hypothetical protein